MIVQQKFANALVRALSNNGLRHALVCPGSRSTPLALAFENNADVQVHVRLDERSAGFVALGISVITKRPVAVVTTSGTAAAELLPAIVEASLSNIPLIAITADRPHELYDVGASQTIRQSNLFGSYTHYATSWPVPSERDEESWDQLGLRLIAESSKKPGKIGPVHLNVSFDEPLLDKEYNSETQIKKVNDESQTDFDRKVSPSIKVFNFSIGLDSAPLLPSSLEANSVKNEPIFHLKDSDQVRAVADLLKQNVLVVVGGEASNLKLLEELSRFMRWPIFREARSNLFFDENTCIVSHFNLFLKDERIRTALIPDSVILFGNPSSSKELSNFLVDIRNANVPIIRIDPNLEFKDPFKVSSHVIICKENDFIDLLPNVFKDRRYAGTNSEVQTFKERSDDFLHTFENLAFYEKCGEIQKKSSVAIENVLAGSKVLSGPYVGYWISKLAPTDSVIFLSSSMPIRDFEWFSAPRSDLTVLSNRGANGIDGVTSTAIGVATGLKDACKLDSDGELETLSKESKKGLLASERPPVIAIIGDLAFLHDLSALVALKSQEKSQLLIVVIDNNGGGIFSFLKQKEILDEKSFDLLFSTPSRIEIAQVSKSLGYKTLSVESAANFKARFERALKTSVKNQDIVILHVRTSREDDIKVHNEIFEEFRDIIISK